MDLRSAILSARDFDREDYVVDRWGGLKVELRSMSARMRQRLIDLAFLAQKKTEAEAGVDLTALFPDMVIDGVFDPESGKRVFSRDDRDALLDKNGDVLQDLAQRIMKLSKIEGAAIEEESKNSSDIPSEELVLS